MPGQNYTPGRDLDEEGLHRQILVLGASRTCHSLGTPTVVSYAEGQAPFTEIEGLPKPRL